MLAAHTLSFASSFSSWPQLAHDVGFLLSLSAFDMLVVDGGVIAGAVL
jgi:hypothetical protein